MFLRRCSDHRNQLFYLFETRLENFFFPMGINCMSFAVWLGEDRNCSAAVVG